MKLYFRYITADFSKSKSLYQFFSFRLQSFTEKLLHSFNVKQKRFGVKKLLFVLSYFMDISSNHNLTRITFVESLLRGFVYCLLHALLLQIRESKIFLLMIWQEKPTRFFKIYVLIKVCH